jgi:hypothetical protein
MANDGGSSDKRTIDCVRAVLLNAICKIYPQRAVRRARAVEGASWRLSSA